MSIKSFPFLGLFIAMLFFSSLTAQDTPTVVIEDRSVMSGETIEFDVLVTKFTSIIASSFSVEWDSTKLRYVGIENIALGLSTDDSFGLTTASGGKINYLYFDNSLMGNTLADNSILFTIRLEVIEEYNSTTNITFGENLEVVDITEMNLNAEFMGAVVQIMGLVDVNDFVRQPSFSASVSPNPFVKDAKILLNNSEAGDLTWTLSDINGQLLAKGVKQLLVGEEELILENTLFKHIGSYVLKLEMNGLSLSKQLIHVEP